MFYLMFPRLLPSVASYIHRIKSALLLKVFFFQQQLVLAAAAARLAHLSIGILKLFTSLAGAFVIEYKKPWRILCCVTRPEAPLIFQLL